MEYDRTERFRLKSWPPWSVPDVTLISGKSGGIRSIISDWRDLDDVDDEVIDGAGADAEAVVAS